MCNKRFAILIMALLCSAFLKAEGEKEDSVLTKSTYYYHTSESYVIDTLLRVSDELIDVHYFSPLKRVDGTFYQQLSTYGSPSQSLVYQLDKSMLGYQPNIFAPYTYNKNNLKFYQLQKPYSELYYSSDLNSAQVFHIIHSQNVYTGLNIGLQYDVNYADGTFNNSQVMNQFFNATANYISPKGSYRALFAFVRNRAYTNESGGIGDDSLFLNQVLESPIAYETTLQSAYTKYKSADFFLTQSLRLPKNFGALTLSTNFDNNTHLYQNIDADTLSSTLDTIEFKFDTRKLTNILSWSGTTKFLPLVVGVRHDYFHFKDQVLTDKNSILSPYANIKFSLKRFAANAYYEKTIANSIYGDNQLLDFTLSFKLDTLNGNNIFVGFANKVAAANYIYYHAKTKNYQWDNNLQPIKTFKATVGAKVFSSLTLTLNYYSIANNIWLSNTLQPTQAQDNANLYQAMLNHHFTAGIFGFIGSIALQHSDDEEAIRLPLLQTKQTAYIEFYMFSHKLKAQIGVDLNYNTAYYSDAYAAELGSFYRQDERKTGNYLYSDLFVSAKISRVNLFLSLTHPYAGLFGYDYYSTTHYPSEGLSFRWGLSWKFFD